MLAYIHDPRFGTLIGGTAAQRKYATELRDALYYCASECEVAGLLKDPAITVINEMLGRHDAAYFLDPGRVEALKQALAWYNSRESDTPVISANSAMWTILRQILRRGQRV
jgi:hypothetical protein